MKHVCVTNYFDVWGNKKEGWEVNNQCHDYYTTNSPMISKIQFLRFLKRINFLRKFVRTNSIIWEDTDTGYVLYDKNYMPVCAVELVSKKEYEFYL